MLTQRQTVFATAYVFSLVALAAIGYMVGDYSVREKAHQAVVPKTVVAADTAFYDLPRMNMTILSSTGSPNLLRIEMSLEVPKQDLPQIDSIQPRLTDRIVEYLRRQDIETLRQAGRQNELKADLLDESNKASYPIPVMDIVFRRFIVL